MVKKTLLLFCIIPTLVFAQKTEILLEPITVVSPRSIYLNCGLETYVGGVSRSYIKVDLPENTVKWYYSFTTSLDRNTAVQLDLATQLALWYLDLDGNIVDLVPDIDVPPGTCGVDIFLLNRDNLNPFLEKEDFDGAGFTFFLEGTTHNTREAVIEIDDNMPKTIYLGLRNPSAFRATNITLEVVAIVETKIFYRKSLEQQRAELLGQYAKEEYKNRNYFECIQYCDSSMQKFPLGWVCAIKGLAQLRLCQTSEAIETYFEAILLIQKQQNAQKVFEEIQNDLVHLQHQEPSLPGVAKILKMIELQLH